jgi:hypothetical protein
MQDRTSARSTKPSCNARPDHTWGQKHRVGGITAVSQLNPTLLKAVETIQAISARNTATGVWPINVPS